MSKFHSYVLAGLGIGVLCGLSTGVAVGGSAYNGTLVFGPLGALIGGLFARRGNIETKSLAASTASDAFDEGAIESSSQVKGPNLEPFDMGILFLAATNLLAGLWNFHIDLLDMAGALTAFKKNPWLFVALAIAISLLFPPFLIIYMVLYVAAASSGASEESDFRANTQ